MSIIQKAFTLGAVTAAAIAIAVNAGSGSVGASPHYPIPPEHIVSTR